MNVTHFLPKDFLRFYEGEILLCYADEEIIVKPSQQFNVLEELLAFMCRPVLFYSAKERNFICYYVNGSFCQERTFYDGTIDTLQWLAEFYHCRTGDILMKLEMGFGGRQIGFYLGDKRIAQGE